MHWTKHWMHSFNNWYFLSFYRKWSTEASPPPTRARVSISLIIRSSTVPTTDLIQISFRSRTVSRAWWSRLTAGCKSSQLFADSDSGLMTGQEGPQHHQFCSQLDSALLLGNQRVAVKTVPGSGASPPAPPAPSFSGSSLTPSRYCDNVSLGKSSKRANWPNGYRKTISAFLDVIGRNIEVNPSRRGC